MQHFEHQHRHLLEKSAGASPKSDYTSHKPSCCLHACSLRRNHVMSVFHLVLDDLKIR